MAYDRTDTSKLGLKELTGFIETKFGEMKAIAKDDGLSKLDPAGVEDWDARNKELEDARKRFSDLDRAAKSFAAQEAQHNEDFKTAVPTVPHADEGAQAQGGATKGGHSGLPYQQPKMLGEMFTEHEEYKTIYEKGHRNGQLYKGGWDPKASGRNLEVELGDNASIKSNLEAIKATMMTSAGWPTYPSLAPVGPFLTAVQEPLVADLIPQGTTTQPAIMYYQETAFVENADFVAEGGLKPEAELALDLVTQPVVKIAVTLPISEEQVMDVPQVRDYVDNRLTLMVKRKEEWGLLDGTGTSNQLLGFHNVPDINVLARNSAEDNPDTILRAITQVNSITGYANASGIVMHPLQWLAIRLLRTKTGDYIWGHPAIQGPATLWGLPVIPTVAQTDGRALVGDFKTYSHISRRMGIRIDIGYINDDFRRDIQRIRLEERLSLEVYRAKAFCEVTGLNKAPGS